MLRFNRHKIQSRKILKNKDGTIEHYEIINFSSFNDYSENKLLF